MGTIELFRAFDERIKAPEAERETALKRLVSCAGALCARYYPSERGSDHLTIIGSTVKNTATKPMGDADGVFHMPLGTYHRFTNYAGNGQSALLQDVREILAQRYPSTKIRGDGPVVVVEFTSGPNVEIVPGVLFSDGADILHANCLVPVTRHGGTWEGADYGAEYDSVMALDKRTDSQYTRLIRYMKAWRREWNVTFKSLPLELMAAEFMAKWPTTQTGHVYDDWLVRNFLAHMIANYSSHYALPSGKIVEPGTGWLNQAKKSYASAATACDFGESSMYYATYWKQVFGSDFGA